MWWLGGNAGTRSCMMTLSVRTLCDTQFVLLLGYSRLLLYHAISYIVC